jgi:sulfur relay (sulfurtransferase) complex TusBCD TusD component (DsrE family)
MKLGIILATRDDLPHAIALARAARRAKHEVSMFAMDAGVHALAADPDAARTMLDDDCEITVCSNSAVGIELPEGVERGSQDDHAAVLGTSDRVVALT